LQREFYFRSSFGKPNFFSFSVFKIIISLDQKISEMKFVTMFRGKINAECDCCYFQLKGYKIQTILNNSNQVLINGQKVQVNNRTGFALNGIYLSHTLVFFSFTL